VSEGDATPEESPRRRKQSSSRGLAGVTGSALAAIASQAVVLTAVLYYFGWVRTKATYGYFGIDVSVLNFSTSDYVLHSVDAAFPLLLAIGLLGVTAMVVYQQMRSDLDRDRELAGRLARGIGWTGAALAAVGFILALAFTGPNGSDFWGPAVLLIGFTLTASAFAVRYKYGISGSVNGLVVMTSMAVLAFLWTITAYANYIGIQMADHVRLALPAAAEVTVYSSNDLSVSGPGITMSRIRIPDSEYRFRYEGLRMLVSSGGEYFLLPSGWHPGRGSVIVLPIAPSGGADIRVEFTVPVSSR
jgi:hypothetical protein